MLNTVRTRLASLNQWQQQSPNRRIFTAAMTVGGMTFLVKGIATFKEILVANWFGTSDEIDAYLVAYLLAFFFVSVIAESFNGAFMPIFIEVREKKGVEAAKLLFGNAMFFALILLSFFALLLVVTTRFTLPLLGSSFGEEKLGLTRQLFFMMIPILIIRGVSTIWSAILNTEDSFALSSITPILVPIAILLFIQYKKTVYIMAVGTVIGFILEMGLIAISLRQHGFSLWPSWSGMTPELREVVRQYRSIAAGVFLMASTGLIDQAMAAKLGSGNVASLTYANRIVAVILGIGAVALGTAVLPYFSKMIVLKDWGGVQRSFRLYTFLVLSTTIPLTLAMIIFSEPLVRFLYEGGEFTAQDTSLVSRLQDFYVLQIPFYLVFILEIRLISALKFNQVILGLTLLSLILNITLDVLFISYWGLAGIALSTVFVYIFSLVYLSIFLKRKLDRLQDALESRK